MTDNEYTDLDPKEGAPSQGDANEPETSDAPDVKEENVEELKKALKEAQEKLEVINELHELAYDEAAQLEYLPKQVVSVRGKSHLFLRLFTVFLVIFIVLFFTTARFVFGKGWIKNMLDHSGNFMKFTIPISDHPELEDIYYQPDGRYTTEGVYVACSPSIVTIESFVDDTVFAAYGQGSGIIMTSDGYIITNAHVINDAKLAIIVRLSDGTEYSAKVIGSDPKSDLAVIKITATDLTPAQFGNSSQLSIGEQIVAIGSPAGFELSTTVGIVSGLDRMIRVESTNISMSCIQIDAAINPGNSGGALLNMWGQVVGITSSKLEAMEYDNIGFAISMDAAKPILEELIENGEILGRPKIGISFYEVSDAVAKVYGTPAGLNIADISPDCDIANTELAIDDYITEMNGIKVRSADDVFAIINHMHAGDTITAKVIRPHEDAEWEEFEITFKLMEDTTSAIQPEDDEE